MDKDKIYKTIDQLVMELSKDLDIQEVILFGSYAYGNPTVKSDIDLCLVANDGYFDEHDYFMFCALGSNVVNMYLKNERIEYDLIGCTLQDLINPPNGLIQDVSKKGILLYDRSENQIFSLDKHDR